jgi:uncharacterized membrane protein required for colicin V production
MFDFALFMLFIYLVFFSSIYGLTYVSIRIVGIIFGVILAIKLSNPLADALSPYIQLDKTFLKILAFSFIVSLMVLLVFLAKVFISNKLPESGKFFWIDRIAGGIVGFILYIVILITIVQYSQEYSMIKELTQNSKIIEVFKSIYLKVAS